MLVGKKAWNPRVTIVKPFRVVSLVFELIIEGKSGSYKNDKISVLGVMNDLSIITR